MALPLVSIIIPVYNIEKYLKCCIESVCNQNYHELEIILVDDGSRDSCPIICDENAKKDPRITSLHKNNGGLSDARNYGMKSAKGAFIFFLDGADFIPNDAISHLVKLQNDNNSDIVIGNMVHVAENADNDFSCNQSPVYSINFNPRKSN